MADPIFAVFGHKPAPWGPRSEEDAVAAAQEVQCDGLLTGGPHTPDEWYHWNAARIAGWPGRYPIICPAAAGPFALKA